MDESNRSVLNVLCGITGLVGAFLLYWGVMSLRDPSYIPSVTVPWLDQTLTAVGSYIWIPAIGVFLILVGVSPVVASVVRSSRIAQIVIGALGIGFLLFGGMFAFITLSLVGGLIFVIPLFLIGMMLLVLAFSIRKSTLKNIHPS